MSTTENVKVTISNISGINLQGLNIYNMALCTEDFDGANKDYVTSRFPIFSNIGIGRSIYQSTQNTIALFRSIATGIFTTFQDDTSLYINTNMFYMPYPRKKANTTTLGGNFDVGASNFDSSVLSPNGKIYAPPISTTFILIIDPILNSFDTTSILFNFEGRKYSSSNLAPNGKIYCIPNSETRILIIDPMLNSIDTTSIVVSGMTTDSAKWHSSITNSSGILYGMPRNETRVLIINTNTNTASTIMITQDSATENHNACSLAPNGKIYSPPFFGSSHVLIIDTQTNICDTTSMPVGGILRCHYHSATLAPNGKIYCFPSYANASAAANVLIIDTNINVADTTTITLPVASVANGNYAGSVLAADGFVYSFCQETTSILILDPNKNSIDTTTIGIFPAGSTNGYTSGVFFPNGKIYCPPWQTTRILIIDTNIPVVNMNQCLNLCQNKG